jgi:hypothetical protein
LLFKFQNPNYGNKEAPVGTPTPRPQHHQLDDDDLGGGEDQGEDVVYDLTDRGQFNQKNKDGKDTSNEETKSSWSSSEEALMACEGLIYNVPLNGGTQCTKQATAATLDSIRTEITLEVSETGFYYFIFANENEITDNFLSAKFDLHKTVFDVSNNEMNCTEAIKCVLPLKFWSEDHVVLEVPEYQPQKNETASIVEDLCRDELLLRGFSSLEECHQVLLAESICIPRKPLYMLFLLLVPILILFCAHV